MASHLYVLDASARRTMIKTQPNTYLRTVLDEACSKMKLDPEQYTLKCVVLVSSSPSIY